MIPILFAIIFIRDFDMLLKRIVDFLFDVEFINLVSKMLNLLIDFSFIKNLFFIL